MKPCPQNRRLLAWLAVDALGAEAARKLRAHLDACPGCRRYWQEIAAVCREHLAAADTLPAAIADDSIHRRLRQRIQLHQARPQFMKTLDALWRWMVSQAVPLATAAVVFAGLAIVLLCVNRGQVTAPPTGVMAVGPSSTTNFEAPPPPTFAAYRAAANTSLDALDELLTVQAARSGRSAEAVIVPVFSRMEPEN